MPSNDSLLIFRNEINDIDKKIVKLLSERKILVLKIAQSKLKNNQEIRDSEREKKLLKELTDFGKKYCISPDYITRLFQLIIEESVLSQQQLSKNFFKNNNLDIISFSFLGSKGSYSNIAALEYANKHFKNYSLKEYSNFKEVILSVENKQSDYAVLPIENSCSGFINEIYNVLKETNLFIIGEINIYVNHCLLALKKSELHQIKQIYSHPQPFQQCSDFIQKFPYWKVKYTASTTDAMKKINELDDITNAALGSEIGGKIYQLNILSKNIANQINNTTRFVLLHRKPVKISSTILTKTALILILKKESNALSEILIKLHKKKLIIKQLIPQNINDNSLEKFLYIDIQLSLSSKFMQDILKEIKKHTKYVKILGCYPIDNKISKIL